MLQVYGFYISKCVHLKDPESVKENNNTIYESIKMKPIDVKPGAYTNLTVEINTKNLEVKVDDHTRISKYQNIFLKGYTPTSSKKCLLLN